MNQEVSVAEKRIEYIDLLKYLGIFAIYLGHLGDAAGMFYPFVFQYHVPLFFFISGCMEAIGKKRKTLAYVSHKGKTILIPWLFFALLSTGINAAESGSTLTEVKRFLLEILRGCIRNHFFAGSLWFLTCLFVVSVIFHLIVKIRCKSLMLMLCLILFAVSETILPHRPIAHPAWYWNVDSAMYYLIFYCLGFIMFPYIHRMLTSEKRSARMLCIVCGLLSFLYSALLFFGKDSLSFAASVSGIRVFLPVTRAMLVIIFNIILRNHSNDKPSPARLGRAFSS